MRPNEAFKVGFLARCVEVGLSPTETKQLAKQASACFTKAGFASTLGGLGKLTSAVVGSVGLPALTAAAVAPPALGGMAAYLYNKATDADANDVKEIKQKELIQTYRRMADQLRRHRRIREQRSSSNRSSQVFL